MRLDCGGLLVGFNLVLYICFSFHFVFVKMHGSGHLFSLCSFFPLPDLCFVSFSLSAWVIAFICLD